MESNYYKIHDEKIGITQKPQCPAKRLLLYKNCNQMFYLHNIQLLLGGGLLFLQPGAQLRANLEKTILNIISL